MEASRSSDRQDRLHGIRAEHPIIRVAVDEFGRRAFAPLAGEHSPVLALSEPPEPGAWTRTVLADLVALLRDPKWERRGAVVPVVVAAADLGDAAGDALAPWLEAFFHDIRRRTLVIHVMLVVRHLSGGFDAPDEARIHAQVAAVLDRVIGPGCPGREAVTIVVVGDATGRNAYLSPEDCVVKATHVLRMLTEPAATPLFVDGVLRPAMMGPVEANNLWGLTHGFAAADLHRFRLPIELQDRGRRAKRALALRSALEAVPPRGWQPATSVPELLPPASAQSPNRVEPPSWPHDLTQPSRIVYPDLARVIDDWASRTRVWIDRERNEFDERLRTLEADGQIISERHREVIAADIRRVLRDSTVPGFWTIIERLVGDCRSQIGTLEQGIPADKHHGVLKPPDFPDPTRVANKAKDEMERAIYARPNLTNVALSLALSAIAIIALGSLAMQPDRDTLIDGAVTSVISTVWAVLERYAIIVALPPEVWFGIVVGLVFILLFWLIKAISRRRVERAWQTQSDQLRAWLNRSERNVREIRQQAVDRINRRILNQAKSDLIGVTARSNELRRGLEEIAIDVPEGRPSRNDPDVIILRPEPLDRFSTTLDVSIVGTCKVDAPAILRRFRGEPELPFWLVGMPTDDDDDPTNDYDPLPSIIGDPIEAESPWTEETIGQLERHLVDFRQQAEHAQFRALRLRPNHSGGTMIDAVDVTMIPGDIEDRVVNTYRRHAMPVHVIATTGMDEAITIRIDRRLTAVEIFGDRAVVAPAPVSHPDDVEAAP